MVFPVVTYSCENWTVKKAECQRIDAFRLWCWRRLFATPWTVARQASLYLTNFLSFPKCMSIAPVMLCNDSTL